ncbi:MAG: hypothetical protein U0271_43285 [Polyangiaceae bacterium]
MMMRALALTVFLAATALGCGDSGSGGGNTGGQNAGGGSVGGGSVGGDGGGGSGSMSTGGNGGDSSTGGAAGCVITVTGGVSKTFANCTVGVEYSAQDGGGLVIQSVEKVMGAPEASFAMHIPGDFSVQTYQWADSVDQGGALFEGGTSAWSASQGDGKGSSSVTIEELTVTNQDANGTIYDAHGSVTATLVSATGAGADVEMNILF